jgi:hypothetical protein
MSTCSLLISIAIMALVSAGAVFLIPVLKEREVAVEVAEIQAAAAAFREAQQCAGLPNTATLDEMGISNLSSSVAGVAWLVDFTNGRGVIDATTADERLGSMIARAGGGERVGIVTSIPVRRPAALDRTSPEAHQIRRYFAGATMC